MDFRVLVNNYFSSIISSKWSRKRNLNRAIYRFFFSIIHNLLALKNQTKKNGSGRQPISSGTRFPAFCVPTKYLPRTVFFFQYLSTRSGSSFRFLHVDGKKKPVGKVQQYFIGKLSFQVWPEHYYYASVRFLNAPRSQVTA